jgi:hypothetical protein
MEERLGSLDAGKQGSAKARRIRKLEGWSD